MGNLSERLMEELACETVFSFSVGGYQIDVLESTVVSWIVMAVILIFCLIFGTNLKVHNPGKRQVIAEFIVTWLENFVSDMIGPEGTRYVPYLVSVLLYIGLANLIGLFGFKPPTKDLNVTIALAVMSILLVQGACIRSKGVWGWVKNFSHPMWVVTPINLLELIIRPLSLCMRLFGNVLGAFVIMELIKCIVPVGIPVIFSAYFDIFDGLIQAYVFVFLTSLYLKEVIETEPGEATPKKAKTKNKKKALQANA